MKKKLLNVLIFLGISSSIFGQIQYHKLSKDTVITIVKNYAADSAIFKMDINDDLEDDLIFELSYKYNFSSPMSSNEDTYVSVNSMNGTNQFSGTPTGLPCDFVKHHQGDTIDNRCQWNPFSDLLYFVSTGPFSCYNDPKEYYLAFTDTINDACHYGWILLSIVTHNKDVNNPLDSGYVQLTVKEFAYNNAPNQGLITGDTITSLIQSDRMVFSKTKDLAIYPNPTSGRIFIKDINFNKIEIVDNSGNVLLQTNCDEIDLENYSNGIYFMLIYTDGTVIKRKLIKN